MVHATEVKEGPDPAFSLDRRALSLPKTLSTAETLGLTACGYATHTKPCPSRPERAEDKIGEVLEGPGCFSPELGRAKVMS